MIKVALVKLNKVSFPQMEKYAFPLLYKNHTKSNLTKLNKQLNDYIWSELEPYVSFMEVDSSDTESYIEHICEKITERFDKQTATDFFFRTELSFSYPSSQIELLYAQPMWKGYVDSQQENMNNIGCLFSLLHTVIENDCVLIANDFDHTNPKFAKQRSIRPKDIIKGIRRRYFNTAQLISNDHIIKYYYQNPIELIKQALNVDDEKDQLENGIIEFLGYRLIFAAKISNENTEINAIATRLCGTNKIHGNVLLFHERDEKILDNLSKKEVQDLNQLAYGRYDDRAIRESEKFENKPAMADEGAEGAEGADGTENGAAPPPDQSVKNYWSKHLIRQKRMSEKVFPHSCICCFRTLGADKINCPNCHRTIYCSTHCMTKDFREFHYKECIYTD